MSNRQSRRDFLRSGLLFSTALTPLGGALATSDPAQEGEGGVSLELAGTYRGVHDPTIIKAGDRYFLFATGTGIPIRQSADLIHWEEKRPTRVFGASPAWTREAIPGASNLWAPEVVYFNDKYHVYYSISTFGSNRSAIGLVTNVTLDIEDEAFEWVDEGMVVESNRSDNHNAIDPAVTFDAEGVPWLSFGSHWGGIKMHRLDYDTGKPAEDDPTLYSLAQRRVHPRAVEAPYIMQRDEYYYLFVSFDQCCRGADSTYRVMVGRSEQITGPYVDREGVDMMHDGGTQITFPTERWRGPGHNSILQDDGVDYIVYHSYDAEFNGHPTLRIDPLSWDDEGWPFIDQDA